jgi:hypothetical protein
MLLACLSVFATGWEWALNIGSGGNERAWDLATDTDANIFVTGSFTDSMAVGSDTLYCAGVSDIFVLKCSASGQILWAQSFGGSSEDVALSIDTDPTGNCYVTGYFNEHMQVGDSTLYSNGSWDIFVIKLSPIGDVIFGQSFGGASNDIGYGISCAADRIFVTGWFGETMQLSAGLSLQSFGGSDIYVAALDSAGNVLWGQSAGTEGVDYGYKIANDGLGSSYITGVCSNTTAFGTFLLPGTGAFVAKYDLNGNFQWANRGENAGVNSISVRDGRGMLTGRISGSAQFGEFSLNSIAGSDDIYNAGFDAISGEWQYAQSAGGEDSDRGRACYIGDYSVSTGSYSATSNLFGIPNQIANGAYDIYIYVDDRYNPTWDLAQRLITVGGSENDVATDIVLTPDIVICGWFGGSCSFGEFTLDTGNGANANMFVAKYAMPGTAVDDVLPEVVSQVTFPNPFRPHHSIRYELSKNAKVNLRIYNLRGQIVRNLIDQQQAGGNHQIAWDARDNKGKALNSGMYIMQLQIDGIVTNRKLLLYK